MPAGRLSRRFVRVALQAVPLVLGVILLNFTLIQLLPGDAAEAFAAESGAATQETMDMLRVRFGVDQPVFAQLINYFHNLSQFYLGFSARYNAHVTDLILARLQMTVLLKFAALVLAFLLGILFGVIMERWRNRWPDKLLSLLSLVLYSTPGFWIGLMLIVVFSVHLGWLPPEGSRTLGGASKGWAYAWDVAQHMVLPVVASATFFVAIFARLTRGAMVEARTADHVRTARAKGLTSRQVTFRHVLRNALIPLSTITGMHVGALLGGSVVIETIFSWPGLGRLTYEAVLAREYVVLLGILLISSILVITANILTDLVQTWLDPRIEA
ncbi:ABC transporter permease [Phyllobacterium lublinensis]|uniref:ABC transporter permease n=1 Tax=Phyllobacterium lublinensis TaxID=2875708 RepID=UPI001CC95206|nr:ABC transporter permease [Phyllobacterium sp. 2063]MBZ9655254.1 ABC transporter permease [Phyllobacterium sp. 2063]